jgi:hypothetical protein
MNFKKKISFKYRCEIQARFVRITAKQSGLTEHSVAVMYGKKLAQKIDSKYEVGFRSIK